MDNIVNYYPLTHYSRGSHLEVLVCDDDGERKFVIVNTDSGLEEEISERAALLICTTPDSTITPENWEDFCTARGVFVEDN
jgi:hypothetical protein